MDITTFILSHAGECSFANITTRTNPVKVKKSRNTGMSLFDTFAHNAIIKMGMRNVSIGNTYGTAVNNRIEKLNITYDFTSMPRVWGKRIGNSAIIEHKEKTYLEYFYLNANKSEYKFIFDDGTELNAEQLHKATLEFFATMPSRTRQTDAGLNPEDQVLVNDIAVENIQELHAFGEIIKV